MRRHYSITCVYCDVTWRKSWPESLEIRSVILTNYGTTVIDNYVKIIKHFFDTNLLGLDWDCGRRYFLRALDRGGANLFVGVLLGKKLISGFVFSKTSLTCLLGNFFGRTLFNFWGGLLWYCCRFGIFGLITSLDLGRWALTDRLLFRTLPPRGANDLVVGVGVGMMGTQGLEESTEEGIISNFESKCRLSVSNSKLVSLSWKSVLYQWKKVCIP